MFTAIDNVASLERRLGGASPTRAGIRGRDTEIRWVSRRSRVRRRFENRAGLILAARGAISSRFRTTRERPFYVYARARTRCSFPLSPARLFARCHRAPPYPLAVKSASKRTKNGAARYHCRARSSDAGRRDAHPRPDARDGRDATISHRRRAIPLYLSGKLLE